MSANFQAAAWCAPTGIQKTFLRAVFGENIILSLLCIVIAIKIFFRDLAHFKQCFLANASQTRFNWDPPVLSKVVEGYPKVIFEDISDQPSKLFSSEVNVLRVLFWFVLSF